MDSALWKMMDAPPVGLGPPEKKNIVIAILTVRFSTFKKWWRKLRW